MKISEMTREDLSERLILSVENSSVDEDFLLTHPHIIKGSFALICCLYADKKGSDEKELITVTNEELNSFGISKSELFSLAMENSKSLLPVMSNPLEEFIDPSDIFQADGVNLPRCVLLTNKDFFNGAAAMFYQPDVLSKISNKFKCNELYIIPYSKAAVFCIESSNKLSLDELKMITSDFISSIDDNNKLIDNVVLFDSTNNLLKEEDGISYPVVLNEISESQTVGSVARFAHR